MAKRRLHEIIDGVEKKYCPTCEDWLSLNSFCKSKQTWDGLNGRCKLCHKGDNKVYYQNNTETIKDRIHTYYREHKEQIGIREKLYRQQHAEKYKDYRSVMHNLRRRKLQDTNNPLTLEEWAVVKDITNGRCIYCDSKEELTQDHIVAISKGGKHSIGNVILSCKSCNLSKGSKDVEIWYIDQEFFNQNRLFMLFDYMCITTLNELVQNMEILNSWYKNNDFGE